MSPDSSETMKTKMDTGGTIVKENGGITAGKSAIWHGHAGQSAELNTTQVVEVDAVDEVVVEDAAGEVTEGAGIQMQIMHPFLALTNWLSGILHVLVSPENVLYLMARR